MIKTKIMGFVLFSLIFFLLIGCASESLVSAKLYIQQEDWDNAEIYLVKALNIEPENPEVPYLLGNLIYGRRQEWGKMNEMFDRALNLGEDKIILQGGKVIDYVTQARERYQFILLRENVEVITDEFEPTINIYGIEDIVEDNILNQYFIRSFIDKVSKEISHQIYVSYRYQGDWRFYRRANVSGGEEFKFIEIDRDVDCSNSICTYYEQFGIIIPDEYLRDKTNGFSIKISAKSGHSIALEITGTQVNEQIRAIDSLP